MDAKKDLAEILNNWSQFTGQQQVAPNVDPVIARSWHRCVPRLDPRRSPRWLYVRPEVLTLTRRKNAMVLNIATPIMEDCYEFCAGHNTVLLLSDTSHCVLLMMGDEAMLNHLHELGFAEGVFLDEGRLGTNAASIALLEAVSVRVIGAEHFMTHFHGLCSTAAPIFTPEGVPVAVISMIQPVEQHSLNRLSTVVMTARAIENQLKAEILTQTTNLQATELNRILGVIGEGTLVWRATGVITHMNPQAGRMLHLLPNMVVGRPLSDYLTLPEVLARAISRGEEIRLVETAFMVNGQLCPCLVSVQIVRGEDQQPVSYIATLHEIEKVRQIVHQFVGVQARLTLDEIIGKSAAIQRVRRQALTAAKAQVSVLLQGEEGTGKNTLARAIHNSSARASGPFITIHCRAIPRELALGEFLGIEAGAFNSYSTAGQLSKFELADGGTLYLHEIDALPLDTQAALVRVIETGDVIRLGGRRVIPIDVRIIASTTTDLDHKIKEGTFRSDLFFRLSAMAIALVPLRDRPTDIPLIIEHLLDKLSIQHGRKLAIDSRALELLNRYSYPGNLTELESILERAALLCDGPTIHFDHLPLSVREPHAWNRSGVSLERVHSLIESERHAILAAGRAAHANLTRTAELLGIGRTTLWRKMRELAISVDDLR